MSVKKIFIILITIVACVIIGAFVLNTLMPNVVTGMVNSTEDMIYNATGMSFDFNGDGRGGTSGADSWGGDVTDSDGQAENGAGVEGFK